MKSVLVAVMMAFASLFPLAAGSHEVGSQITKVVKLLQSMLDKSKADGDSERSLYAKFKCYCDQNEESKTQALAEVSKEITLLENKIDNLKSSTAQLSEDAAKLSAEIAKTKEGMDEATKVRESEKTDFKAMSKDLNTSIALMKEAIVVLSEVGADQTMGQAAADHDAFMANYDKVKSSMLVKLKSTVRQAMVAASSIMKGGQTKSLAAFVQDPKFTGTYSSASGEVIGILKEMRDTFDSNLKTAEEKEATALKAYENFMTAQKDSLKSMEDTLAGKQEQLSGNDSNLASAQKKLSTAQAEKAEAESFLTELQKICAEKAKQYETRTALRTNEQAAIAQAISILNSDEAFETFGKVESTKGKLFFLQRSSIKRHVVKSADKRQLLARQLDKVAAVERSVSLSKVIVMLQMGNPFAKVLSEIDKMLELLSAEQKADDEQLEWCKKERDESNSNLDSKKAQILSLKEVMDKLDVAINDPVTGFKVLIKADEESLLQNSESQATETKARTGDNVEYQSNIANLVGAAELLTTAVNVLEKYYSQLLGKDAFLALSKKSREEPAPPETWDGEYKGQGEKTDAISLLKFILENTQKEETAAHDAELAGQHAFEDSMTNLKKEEASLQENIAALRLSLATKEKELIGKREDLEATTAAKESVEAYLLKIKPGCDFITTHIDERTKKRGDEKAALENAQTLIKGTPAYLVAQNKEA
mmetsp:Transcript_23641/g.45933  ORF Transcript_23641/g.45933 Transcript_23641/m.45933 type:complete len:708 (-) Transcript_23641:153-2276(-)